MKLSKGDVYKRQALDEALDGTCTIDAVVGRINDEVLGGGGDLQLEVLAPVSYTHLDVYKRQAPKRASPTMAALPFCGTQPSG